MKTTLTGMVTVTGDRQHIKFDHYTGILVTGEHTADLTLDLGPLAELAANGVRVKRVAAVVDVMDQFRDPEYPYTFTVVYRYGQSCEIVWDGKGRLCVDVTPWAIEAIRSGDETLTVSLAEKYGGGIELVPDVTGDLQVELAPVKAYPAVTLAQGTAGETALSVPDGSVRHVYTAFEARPDFPLALDATYSDGKWHAALDCRLDRLPLDGGQAFLYTDPAGKRYLFTKTYMYEKEGTAATIDKDQVDLTADGTLTYTDEQGQQYVVTEKAQGPEGLTLTTSVGFRNGEEWNGSDELGAAQAECEQLERQRQDLTSLIAEYKAELVDREKLFTDEYQKAKELESSMRELSVLLEEYAIRLEKHAADADDPGLRKDILETKKQLNSYTKRVSRKFDFVTHANYNYIRVRNGKDHVNRYSEEALLSQYGYDIAVDRLDSEQIAQTKDGSVKDAMENLLNKRQNARRRSYELNDIIADYRETLDELTLRLDEKNNAATDTATEERRSYLDTREQMRLKQKDLNALREKLQAETEQQRNDIYKERLKRLIDRYQKDLGRVERTLELKKKEAGSLADTTPRYAVSDGETTLCFGGSGRLATVVGRGKTFCLSYGKDGVSAVTEGEDRCLYRFEYADGRLRAVIDDRSGCVRYAWREDGLLDKTEGPDGDTRFMYDDAGRLIEAIGPTLGVSLEYDQKGAVERCRTVTYTQSIAHDAVTPGIRQTLDPIEIGHPDADTLTLTDRTGSTTFLSMDDDDRCRSASVCVENGAWTIAGAGIPFLEERRTGTLDLTFGDAIPLGEGGLVHMRENGALTFATDAALGGKAWLFTALASVGTEHFRPADLRATIELTMADGRVTQRRSALHVAASDTPQPIACPLLPALLPQTVTGIRVTLTPDPDAPAFLSEVLVCDAALVPAALVYQETDDIGRTVETYEDGTRISYAYGESTVARTQTAPDGTSHTAVVSVSADGTRRVEQSDDGMVDELTVDASSGSVTRCRYHRDDPAERLVREMRMEDGHSAEILARTKGREIVRRESVSCGGICRTLPSGQAVREYPTKSATALEAVVDGAANRSVIGRTAGLTSLARSGAVEYAFEYDGFGRRTAFKVNGAVRSSRVYDGETVTETFADGSACTQSADETGTTVHTLYTDAQGDTQQFERAVTEKSTGKIRERVDTIDNTEYNKYGYSYDTAGRLQRLEQDAYGSVLSVAFERDLNGRVIGSTVESGGSASAYSVRYDDRSTSTTAPDGTVETVAFDALGRVGSLSVGENYRSESGYVRYDDRTTGLLASHTAAVNGAISDRRTYVYDDAGNIVSAEENGTEVARYRYDGIGRLTREDDRRLDRSTVYRYDAGGNIVEKRTGSYAPDSQPQTAVTYAYDGEGRLTSYDGQPCEYCGGEPVLYRGVAAEWVRGGRLRALGNVRFDYNARGLRVKKTVGETVTRYTVVEGKLLWEDRGAERLTYRWGASGMLGFSYRGTRYLFGKNGLGDVTELYQEQPDGRLTLAAKYVYDAWGNHAVFDPAGAENDDPAFIGNVNPIRYRSYYYDEETGLYYLQSRYYDPEVGRFLSADDIDVVLTLQSDSPNGLNLYAYCLNNPVMLTDSTGTSGWTDMWNNVGQFFQGVGNWFANTAKTVWGGVVGFFSNPIVQNTLMMIVSASFMIGGVFLTFYTNKPIGPTLFGAGIGSLIGGITNSSSGGTFVGGWTGGIISGGLTGFAPFWGTIGGTFLGAVVTDLIDRRPINWKKAGVNALVAGMLDFFAGSFSFSEAGKGLLESSALARLIFLIRSFITGVLGGVFNGKKDKLYSKMAS